MENLYSVTLEKIIKAFDLKTVYLPREADTIRIKSTEINRPGLQLAGFFDYFDAERIQIFGKSESAFLELYPVEKRIDLMEEFLSRKPAAVVVTRELEVPEYFRKSAEKHGCPLMVSGAGTSEFIAALIALLHVELAPRITRHGVLVEVYGEGILLLGESGVGKSETAMELLKRGHRLIADDSVEIRRVSARTLVGSSPENIRHFMELRGIGIINVRRIFGIGSVKMTQQIDMVIQMEPWNQEKFYDRIGSKTEYTEILGNKVTALTIPVKPGRNLAIIIEVAAMNNRQQAMGYNSAKELFSRLGMQEDTLDN